MLLRIFVTWEDWSSNYRKDWGPNWQTQNSTFEEPVQLVLKQSSDWICDSSWDNFRVCGKTMNETKLWSFSFVRFWSRKLEHYQHCYTSSFDLHMLCSKTSKPKNIFQSRLCTINLLHPPFPLYSINWSLYWCNICDCFLNIWRTFQ